MRTFPSPKIYDALDFIMNYYPDNFTERARTEVEMLLDYCLEDIGNNSEKFLSTLIIKALRHLIGPTTIDEHIYLKKYEITQIELFNVLIKEFPFVKWGHEFANTLMFQKLEHSKKAIIIDVGIGQGIQIQHLLEKLGDSKELEELVIVGIEPFKDALVTAEELVRKISEDLPFKVTFVPVNIFVQELDAESLRDIIGKYEGEIMISSSLALHHIQTQEERTTVLEALRALNPLGIVLVEPNSDHYVSNFRQRFQNCYQHFYHIFQVIDNLDIDPKSKNGLKLFFGREIEDIVGKHNDDRYEKHEPASNWIEKLSYTGFVPKNNFINNLPNINSGIRLEFKEEGYLGFTYKSETILAIIYAESK